MMSILKITGYRMSSRSSVPLWVRKMRRSDLENWLSWEKVNMMDGSLVLALVSTIAAVQNGIGLLIIWKNVCHHFFH